jgi:hypothetical protein
VKESTDDPVEQLPTFALHDVTKFVESKIAAGNVVVI